ncbi:transporter [Perkinsus olseni]|uniref:Transporter n=1 Tax=Perkinsus olseni TaxID=32597 RepID=A0A7J6R354_PEROL|nr:transporter [Perkinsus olseni]KAF4758914.1 transporter [Perkinsus olseni]
MPSPRSRKDHVAGLDCHMDGNECVLRISEEACEDDTQKPSVKPAATTASIDAWLLLQMGMFGFVALSPWNFVLAELAYLNGKFEHYFGSTLPIFYGAAVNFTQILLIWYGNRFTFLPRFTCGCIMLSVFPVLLAIFAMTIGEDNLVDNTGLGFALGLVCVFFLGTGYGLLESSALGLAALCSPKCISAIMVGEGASGLLGWPINTVLNLALDASSIQRVPEWRCLIFFIISSLIALIIIPMFRFSTSKHPYMMRVLEIESSRTASTLASRQTRRPIINIVWEVLPIALCVWFTMTVTFTVFPSQVVLWQSSNPNNLGFVAQVTYTFQVVDTIGRFLPSVLPNLRTSYLMVYVASRVLLVPLFICTSLYSTAVPFDKDWFMHIEMAVLAFTNGTCVTMSMVAGPSRVSGDKTEQEVAGYTMSFGIVSGILFGSVFGLLTNVGLDQ